MNALLSIRPMTIHACILFFVLGLQPCTASAQQCSANISVTTVAATSINDYDGNCPCPYSFDKKGHRCGDRSAWSRTGGQTPACFPMNDAYQNTPYSLPTKPASCPCPYSFDENGMRCGDNSMWSKSGGVAPACYTSSEFLNASALLNTSVNDTNKCQCPFDTDENGNHCGDKSEWSRTHGAVANCYPQDN